MFDSKLLDEEGRLAALHRYGVLDTPREKPFDKITSLVQRVLEVPICAVSLVDRDRQWFKSIQGLEAAETPRSVSFCSHTIQTREPLIVPDALADDRFRSNALVTGEPRIGSYAGVPLRTPDGYNLGSLCAIDQQPREFSEAQIGILKSFASLVVDELELRRIADRDHLTGALTRRGFIKQMEKEIARFRRHDRPSVLMVFDIDHFKRVNDNYGHPAGDEVLKSVSESCRAQLRSNDHFGRLGGEEFAILVSETGGGMAAVAAEKFRRLIEELSVNVGKRLSVTASFGVAPISSSVSTPDEWISRADQALYRAKRRGRNCCVLEDTFAQ